LPGSIAAIATQGSYAYVAAGSQLVIVNIADPQHPAKVGALSFNYADKPLRAFCVVVSGSYAYLGVGDFVDSKFGGLRVVDISDPAQPKELGRYTHPPSNSLMGTAVMSAVLAGHYIYVADILSVPSVLHPFAQQLLVLDVANPRAPILVTIVISTLDRGIESNLAIGGHFVYYVGAGVAGQSGVHVLDIANPTAPVEVATYADNSVAPAIAVDGSRLYFFAAGSTVPVTSELRVVDFANPAVPTALGKLQLSFVSRVGNFQGLAKVDDTLYLPDRSALHLIDVADPTAPFEASAYRLPSLGPEFGITAAGASGLILLGVTTNLSLLRYSGLSIGGRVTAANGRTPVPGVSLKVGAATVSSDAQGIYLANHLPRATYTITPELSGFSFVPPTATVTLPPSPVEQPFTVLPKPVGATAGPGLAASLVFTDTQGSATRVEVPTSALTQTTALTVTPTLAPVPPGFLALGHTFTLAASAQPSGRAVTRFAAPVTVTLDYSADDAALVERERLALWWWDGQQWRDIVQVCGPPTAYGRNLAARRLVVPVCRAGLLQLVGPTHQQFFPLAARAS
jgi:hypothetical protein